MAVADVAMVVGVAKAVPTTTAAMAGSRVTVKAVISTRAMSMSARNGLRVPMARSTIHWPMKSAFPAHALTVIAVRPGLKATVVLLRRVTAVRRQMASVAPVANIVQPVRKAIIVRHARKAIAALRAQKVPARKGIVRKAIVATVAPLAVAAIRHATVAAPPSGALRAKA